MGGAMIRESRSSQALWALHEDDLELILRLVLASGSLKELARSYGVSYPTIRSRLDQVIERLQALLRGQFLDPMADQLADLIAKGEVTPGAAQIILDLHRKTFERGPLVGD